MSENGSHLQARVAALEETVGTLGVAVANVVLALGTLNSRLLAGSAVTPAEVEQMHYAINERLRALQGLLGEEWPVEELPPHDDPLS